MTDTIANPTATASAPTIFVSYSRADLKRARPVIAALETAGFSVWWDGMIAAGTRFAQSTEQALEAAQAVVVLWSKTSVDSHWVHDEATRGRDRGCLVPLSIDGTHPPLGFRQFQVIDISKWRGKANAAEFAPVIEAVSALQLPGQQANSAPPPAAVAWGPSRRMLIAGGIGVAIVGGSAAFWESGLLRGTRMIANSIVVMPFENLSGDRSQEYFAAGLAAELRSELSRNAALKVLAKTSSDAFKASSDIAAVARRTGVAYLLNGSVRSAGDIVRIDVELTDARSGFTQWSETYDRPLTDIFSVQSEIAGAVIARLTSEMAAPGDLQQVGGTSNVLAYQEYLRGLDLYARSDSRESDEAALARFDAAIRADPRFAAALAARARTLIYSASQYGSPDDIRRSNSAAQASAQRAVAIAPRFAEGQSTLGLVEAQALLDFRAARVPFERSRALGNGEANVMNRFALYAVWAGRFDEASDANSRALELDPLNAFVHRVTGIIHYAAGRYAAAIEPVNQALALNPGLTGSRAVIGDALTMLGRYAEARDAYQAETLLLLGVTGLAIVEQKLGNLGAARAARQRIVSGLGTGQQTLYQQAQIAAQWGEADAALALLTAAYAARDSGLTAARYDPMLAAIRPQPAFARLLGQMGLA